MNYNTFQNTICMLVETLPKHETHNDLIFNLELIGRIPIFDEAGNFTDYVNELEQFQLVITRKSNYKCVFYRSLGRFGNNEEEFGEWFHTSYHDSCWRSDGLQWIFDKILDLRTNFRHKFPDTFEIHKINENFYYDWARFRKGFQYVNLEIGQKGQWDYKVDSLEYPLDK